VENQLAGTGQPAKLWCQALTTGGVANPDQLRLDERDRNLVSSRKPADLPAFCPAMVELFARL
jgi:hypothetical protein